jgi:hypothetical protein
VNSLRRIIIGMCLHQGPYGHLALTSRYLNSSIQNMTGFGHMSLMCKHEACGCICVLVFYAIKIKAISILLFSCYPWLLFFSLLCLKPNIVQYFHLKRYSTLVLNQILCGTHLTKCHTCRDLTFYWTTHSQVKLTRIC